MAFEDFVFVFIFNYDEIYSVIKSENHTNGIIIVMHIINFGLRCVLIGLGKLPFFMTREGVLEGRMVFIIAEIIYFNGSIIY